MIMNVEATKMIPIHRQYWSESYEVKTGNKEDM